MHMSSSIGSGASTEMGSGRGPRLSSSRRNSTGYTTGTTRSRMGERFYCIAKGCYDRRIGQIRRAAARARAFWLLVVAALLFGGGYVAYKNGSLSRLIDQASGPPARQADEPAPVPHRHHHASRNAAVAATNPSGPGVDGGASLSDQAAPAGAASAEVSPANEQALADAVDQALTSGEVVRWHDADRGVSGEVSVSASQAYADRDCRSYRYTVRSKEGVFTSPGDVGCSISGEAWSYRQQTR